MCNIIIITITLFTTINIMRSVISFITLAGLALFVISTASALPHAMRQEPIDQEKSVSEGQHEKRQEKRVKFLAMPISLNA